MKKNILDFLKEKKEILLFLGVLMLLTGAILTINKLASPPKISDTTNSTNKISNDTNVDVVVPEDEKMILPIAGNYSIVLDFFDVDNPNALENAVINNGNSYFESCGISYAKEDNTAFDVLAVFSGTVTDVVNDDLEKTIVSIEHENGLISKYYSLTDVTLKVNDKVKAGDVIGKASESLFNTSAGIHVHLELLKDKEYFNPTQCFNKTIDEIIKTISK